MLMGTRCHLCGPTCMLVHQTSAGLPLGRRLQSLGHKMQSPCQPHKHPSQDSRARLSTGLEVVMLEERLTSRGNSLSRPTTVLKNAAWLPRTLSSIPAHLPWQSHSCSQKAVLPLSARAHHQPLLSPMLMKHVSSGLVCSIDAITSRQPPQPNAFAILQDGQGAQNSLHEDCPVL